jgi:hypothetical protein
MSSFVSTNFKQLLMGYALQFLSSEFHSLSSIYTFVFGDELRQMLIVIRFGKNCRCRLQAECVMVVSSLKALYREGSRWTVGFDGVDWWWLTLGC